MNDEMGIPQGAEYIEELDNLYLTLEGTMTVFSSRPRKVIVDVYEAIGGLESGGILSFWQSAINQSRTIESLRILGEEQLATLLENGHSYIKDESDTMDTSIVNINSQIWDCLLGVPTKLLKYAKDNNIRS